MTVSSLTRWLGLGDAECADPAVAGAKAARLANAAAAGFPVPESVVVPCSVSVPVLAEAVRRGGARGPHATRLEVMAADVPALDGLEKAVRRLGLALAVRSSAPGEDDPLLAGAFSTVMGVAPAEIAVAVRAVWASAIRPGSPGAVSAMGVLLQPELSPDLAGTAELGQDGVVTVVAVRGAADALMAGWASGVTVTVAPGGEPAGLPPELEADPAVLAEAASMCRSLADALGDTLIEWAWVGDRLWLLQARRLEPAAVPRRPGLAPDRLSVPRPATEPGHAPEPHGGIPVSKQERRGAERMLRATRYPGDLAERWLIPWAAATSLPAENSAAEPANHASMGPSCSPGAAGATSTCRWVSRNTSGPSVRGIGSPISTNGQSIRAGSAGGGLTDARQAGPAESWPEEAWAAFIAVCDRLTEQAGVAIRPGHLGAARPAEPASGDVAAAIRQGGLDLADLGGAAQFAPALVAECLDLAAGLMTWLRERGVIRSWAEFWALPDDLAEVLSGRRARPDAARLAYLAALRWEPPRFAAVRAIGDRHVGTGLAPGKGCGPCVLCVDAAARALSGSGDLPLRPVLVAAYPLPQYAPLLMGAAALITRHGSGAAHLISVARSLGVPAVAGCDLTAVVAGPGECLAAIDGDTGTAWVHAPA